MPDLVFISPYPLRSGITGIHITGYLRRYRQLGHTLRIEKVYFWEHKLRHSAKWLWLLRLAWKRNRIFLLHQHTAPASGPLVVVFLFALRLLGRRALVISHETMETYAKHLAPGLRRLYFGYEGLVLRLASRYVVHNELHRCELHDAFGPRPIEVIPLPMPRVERVSGPRDSWGFYGMVSKKKGVDLLLQAYLSLPAGSAPELRILGAAAPGEEEFYTTLQASVPEAWRPWVHFHGFVAEADKGRLFSACSLFIYPYRWISQSGALPETCMHRAPYLAADLPYFRDFHAAWGLGELFPAGNVSALAQALRRLAQSPLHPDEAAFARLESELSIERCVERLERMFGAEDP